MCEHVLIGGTKCKTKVCIVFDWLQNSHSAADQSYGRQLFDKFQDSFASLHKMTEDKTLELSDENAPFFTHGKDELCTTCSTQWTNALNEIDKKTAEETDSKTKCFSLFFYLFFFPFGSRFCFVGIAVCQEESANDEAQIKKETGEIERLKQILKEEMEANQKVRTEDERLTKGFGELVQVKKQKIEAYEGLRDDYNQTNDELQQLQTQLNSFVFILTLIYLLARFGLTAFVTDSMIVLRGKEIEMEHICEEMLARIKTKEEEVEVMQKQCAEKNAYVSQLVSQMNQTTGIAEKLQMQTDDVRTKTLELDGKIENVRREMNNKENAIQQLTNELWQTNAIAHSEANESNQTAALCQEKEEALQKTQKLIEKLYKILNEVDKQQSECANLLSARFFLFYFLLTVKEMIDLLCIESKRSIWKWKNLKQISQPK
ncbi:BRCT domain protein [Reticulomyxa filosa]|uniref:BRCT domain protein n=1 Tax=Reticulomyxa filosa TaxID=46433 RepID=X6N1V9_RETFI|nr:BRCT domain protein [Reticulomyxa filosa]|eukprot:ETO19297.1 BRCT domain protein [Reticulomyxa filosa]